jgi:hypothetical protein
MMGWGQYHSESTTNKHQINYLEGFLMRHWSLLLSGLFVSAIVLPSPAKASPQHDLSQAFSLAQTAIYKCYQRRDIEECDNLNRIDLTLSIWCGQGDREACLVRNSVRSLIGIEVGRQLVEQATE